MQNIGILGSSVVGQTLARGFRSHGFEVRIASRTPAKLAEFSASVGVPSGTFDDVAEWAARSSVLSVRGDAAEQALSLAGPAHLAGKIVIDTTNPIAAEPPVDGVIQFFTGPNSSLMERLQVAFPASRFVKAFSCVGHARMVNPQFAAGRPTMFYCGNDGDAKAAVKKILEQFGWDAADMGRATAARAIEPLCQLWCIPGFLQNSWSHAFTVLWS